ncbi:MAG: nucleoside recognition domain-containing protein [Thiobacillaceae bacterium]
MLNVLWIGFILLSFLLACYKFLFLGEGEIFGKLISSLFDDSKTAFEISLGLTGVMALWLGVMKVGERAGFIDLLARLMAPLFRRLFPDVPDRHPALGAITLNMAANMLGLDNAATPLGIKAMKELQTLNKTPDTASDAQILFLVINTASVTLLPVTIFTYRAQLGAANPTDVFIPLLLASFGGTLIGLLATSFYQRLRLFDPVTFAYLGGMSAIIGGLAWHFSGLPASQMQQQSAQLGHFILLAVVVLFVGGAALRKVNAYEAFIEGAKEGFNTAVTIIPYLVAMLVAIGLFRASGALEILMGGIRNLVAHAGFDTRFVDALPTALMKPFSGSGARAMTIDTMKTLGADSFAGRLASILQGSTETTFYVLAVYFGAAGVKRARHAVSCGLIADAGGFAVAIAVAYWFFA